MDSRKNKEDWIGYPKEAFDSLNLCKVMLFKIAGDYKSTSRRPVGFHNNLTPDPATEATIELIPQLVEKLMYHAYTLNEDYPLSSEVEIPLRRDSFNIDLADRSLRHCALTEIDRAGLRFIMDIARQPRMPRILKTESRFTHGAAEPVSEARKSQLDTLDAMLDVVQANPVLARFAMSPDGRAPNVSSVSRR